MWVGGINCWSKPHYSIGTPLSNSCLNLVNSGSVIVNYKLASPILQSDIIRGYLANQITIDDNVIIIDNHRLITPLLYATKIKASNATVITIEDDVNVTGNLVLYGSLKYIPCWVAGKVDGTNLNSLSTNGRYGFTVTRSSV